MKTNKERVAEFKEKQELYKKKLNIPVEDVVFPFGKYRGDKVSAIAEEDQGYLKWVYGNVSVPEYLAVAIEHYITEG